MNIKQLRQMKADNDAAQAKLKAEGRSLLAVVDRTPEQTARLDAIDGEINALVASAETITRDLARAERFADEERQQGSADVQFGEDRAAARPWGPRVAANAPAAVQTEARLAALGEFAIAVKNAMSGTGFDPRLAAAASGMNSATGADGGFAVPVEVAAGVERNMYESGQILSRVDSRTISGDAISYNILTETSRVDGSRQGGVIGYWVDQGTAPTASSFKIERIEMKLRKVAALGYMTDELVADAAALGGELESSFANELTFQVENTIYRGNGAGQPLGIMSAGCLVTVSKEAGQAADTLNATNLVKMWARLASQSRNSGSLVWLVNGDCFPQLHNLSFPTASTEVAARFITYGPDGSISIFGKPVIDVEYAATIGDLGDIVLADLSKYRLIRKGGVEQASSMHVRFTQGEQAFRATYRVDGQAVPRSAVTPFKGSATRSPFITLEAR